jgi:gamma-glutamylcyclotransferase (GGCT)/AIG2-like uncharacterized protein YtfP
MQPTHADYPTPDDVEAAAMTYPFFVYGTLRPGYGNDRLWHGRAHDRHDGECYVTGFRLVGRGFPYAIPAEGAEAVGALIVPDADHYEDVTRDLDRLEGVPTHYYRDLVVITTPEGYRVAWMYIASGEWLGHDRLAVPTDPAGRFDWALR